MTDIRRERDGSTTFEDEGREKGRRLGTLTTSSLVLYFRPYKTHKLFITELLPSFPTVRVSEFHRPQSISSFSLGYYRIVRWFLTFFSPVSFSDSPLFLSL